MNLLCPICGGETTVGEHDGFACAACGQWLACIPNGKAWMLKAINKELPGESEALKLVRQSDAMNSHPEKRRKLLDQALALCPDSLAVNKAILMFGRLGERTGAVDFHRFKSYLLHVFDKPEDETPDMRAQMLRELTDHPQLNRCLELAPDRDAFIADYCEAMCRDYVVLFVRENNQYNGSFFGFRLGRIDKNCAGPVARMLRNMKKADLPTPYDTLLPAALRRAFEVELGDISFVDDLLAEEAK